MARRNIMGSIRHAVCLGVLALPVMAQPSQASDAAAAQTIQVAMDQARLIKLPDRVATIVIGNPLIADATLQAGGLAVLTGKGFGATNFIALDRKGAVLLEKIIEVNGPQHMVVVYKGANRETYSCATSCEPTITPGDGEEFFTRILTQTTTRSTQAAAASAPK